MDFQKIRFRNSDKSVFYNCRVKYFADDYIKLTCFNRNIFNPDSITLGNTASRNDKLTKAVEKEKNKNPKRERTDSVKRAKDKIYEIAYANDFNYFITLTIDNNKLSRTEEEIIIKAIKVFLSNLVQRKNLKYIIIPEYHKRTEDNNKRAIHFHGLISGDSLNMVNSGQSYNGRPIFNWVDWKYGFSTAIELDGQKKISQYITKYITKDNNKIFGRYYFSGGKLAREVRTEYYKVDYNSVPGKEYEVIPDTLKVKYMTIDFQEE